MDTSEQYIKMCDCPEIQEKGRKKIEHKSDDKVLERKANYIDISGHFGSAPICNPEWFIWLPRQGQIQEMIATYHDKEFCWVCTLEGLYGFAQFFLHQEHEEELKCWKEKKEYKMPSLEQLWLAFYMHEKHRKTWDGKQWKGSNFGGKEGE